MIKKTYGVHGLMEFLVVVALASRTFKIQFTGGSSNSHGIMPATFTTDNEIIQFAIENCQDFASGKIKLIKSVEIPDPARSNPPAISNNVPEPPMVQAPTVQPQPTNDGVGNEATPQQDESEQQPTTEHTDEQLDAPQQKEEDKLPDGTITADGKVIVNASCKEDVIAYLKEKHNYTSTTLRTKQALVAAVNEHNLEIVGFTL